MPVIKIIPEQNSVLYRRTDQLMIMKKFYSQIFIAAFLLTGFYSQAQVYNSISPNPSGYTFNDTRFWVGSVRPPNPCTGCTISINSTTTMPSTLSNIPSTALPTATNVFTTQTPP